MRIVVIVCLLVCLLLFAYILFLDLDFIALSRLKLTLNLILEPTASANSPYLYLSSLQSFAIEFLRSLLRLNIYKQLFKSRLITNCIRRSLNSLGPVHTSEKILRNAYR